MGADGAPRLAPINILIVEDQVHMAEQLAELLTLWGATTVAVTTSFAEATAYLAARPAPQLLLLDHLLLDGIGSEVALWLLARPDLRRRISVVSYTNSERTVVQQSLQQLIVRFIDDQEFAARLLDGTPPHDQAEAVRLVREPPATPAQQEALFAHLYDAYLSKRRSMREVRGALAALSQMPPDGLANGS